MCTEESRELTRTKIRKGQRSAGGRSKKDIGKQRKRTQEDNKQRRT